MDVSNSMLVAMMFVMVLSIGIGNLLMGLASLVDHRTGSRFHWIPTSWMMIMLLLLLDIFWHVIEILEAKDWEFGSFLYALTGPILLLLALNLMLPAPEAGEGDGPVDQYARISRKFFLLLCGFMLWSAGVDVLLGDGQGGFPFWYVAQLLLFGVLAWSPSERVHSVGTGLAWLLMLSMLGVQASG